MFEIVMYVVVFSVMKIVETAKVLKIHVFNSNYW